MARSWSDGPASGAATRYLGQVGGDARRRTQPKSLEDQRWDALAERLAALDERAQRLEDLLAGKADA